MKELRWDSDRNSIKAFLEKVYNHYHSKQWIGDDPVVFLSSYNALYDREIVALIAALMAYGRVCQIRANVQKLLDILNPSPYESLLNKGFERRKAEIMRFKHRFTSGYQVFHLLRRLSNVICQYGSIGKFFEQCWTKADSTLLAAITTFRNYISQGLNDWGMFLPDPRKGGACKRWLLFLRWMVRKDEIDPGGWNFIKPSSLLIPLDTHMHKVSLMFGFTTRKSSSIKTVIEITEALKSFDPTDPVRYDFSLTRWSMNNFPSL